MYPVHMATITRFWFWHIWNPVVKLKMKLSCYFINKSCFKFSEAPSVMDSRCLHAEPWFRVSGKFTFCIYTCFISTCKALRCKLPAHLRPLLPVSPGAFCAPPRVGFWTLLRLWQSYYQLILVVHGARFLAPICIDERCPADGDAGQCCRWAEEQISFFYYLQSMSRMKEGASAQTSSQKGLTAM